jgi:hypothetical protein
MIDRGWPRQVALPTNACEQGGYKAIHDFCKDLSICAQPFGLPREPTVPLAATAHFALST